MGREQRAIASSERDRLHREQQTFLKNETSACAGFSSANNTIIERLASEEATLLQEEQKRLQSEKEAHDTIARKAAAASSVSSRDPAQQGTGKLILILTVELGDGRSGSIRVNDNSDYRQLAVAFVKQHGLGDGVIEPLAQHITQQVKANAAERKASSRPSTAPATPRSPLTPRAQRPSVAASPASSEVSELKRKPSMIGQPELTLTPRIDERSRRLAEKTRTVWR